MSGERVDLIEVDGVPFERVGVATWGRPAYAGAHGDVALWECARCGALVARPPLHASAHVRSAAVRRDVAAAVARHPERSPGGA